MLRTVLKTGRLCSVVFSLLLISVTVGAGGLVVDRSFITAVQQQVRQLCKELLPDAVALVDSYAPPDFFLHSVLGNADGKVSLSV